MKEHTKKHAGIWMDNRTAYIITSPNEDGTYTIQGKVKSDEYHGDKGEHALNNADRAHSRKYHKELAQQLLNFDEILIFGPGKSQEEFRNFLNEDNHFADKKSHWTVPIMEPIIKWSQGWLIFSKPRLWKIIVLTELLIW